MKYLNTLLCVENMERSKSFYMDILGLDVVTDFGANVTLTGGIALQTKESWKEFIGKTDEDILTKNHAVELYFEEDNIEEFYKKIIREESIELVHPIKEHSWGQRVIRFFDPDNHIIEVGENLTEVIRRFLRTGLTIEETAKRMDISVEFIKSSLNPALEI